MNKYLERSNLRISIAKEYLDTLKRKEQSLKEAYLYGSTTRYSCRELSDIDLILVIEKTASEYTIELLTKYYEAKYGIPISPYYHFTTDQQTEKIRRNLNNEFWIFSFQDILLTPFLKYPEQFITIAYP